MDKMAAHMDFLAIKGKTGSILFMMTAAFTPLAGSKI
jgi:hypothetical protein